MDFTSFMAIVREDLSSPASVISAGELAVIVPVTLVPSRINTVACGASAAGVPVFVQEAINPASSIAGIAMNRWGRVMLGDSWIDCFLFQAAAQHPRHLLAVFQQAGEEIGHVGRVELIACRVDVL